MICLADITGMNSRPPQGIIETEPAGGSWGGGGIAKLIASKQRCSSKHVEQQLSGNSHVKQQDKSCRAAGEALAG